MLDYQVKTLEAMRIAGYSIKTTMQQVMSNNPLPAFWQEIMNDGRHAKLQALKGRCKADYAVNIMLNENDMEYVIGAALEPGETDPQGYVLCDIPAGEYAVCEVTLEGIGKAWADIDEWMGKNGYTWNYSPSFEFYDEKFVAKNILEVYIPIRKLEG